MEDEEGYMVLERRGKRGAAGSPPPLQAAAPGCPRWHRVALGAVWTGNLLLGVAVVALGCSFVLLQPESLGSCRIGNGSVGDINRPLEDFVLELRKTLCPSQLPGAEGCMICPQGWTLGRTKCYWVSTDPNTWSKSQEDCGDRGATLLLPRDRDELEFLNETLQKSQRTFWVGLWVPKDGTGWTWVNGSRLDRHRFQLDLRETPGFCGMIKGDRIGSESCSSLLPWICQKEATKL